MDMSERAPATHVAAAVLMIVKAALGLWAVLVVFSASATRPRSFLGQAVHRRARGAGLVLLMFVVATAAIAVALLVARSWAPPAVYVIEGLAVVLALTRIGSRPRAAVLAIVMSGAIVALVALGSSSRSPAASHK